MIYDSDPQTVCRDTLVCRQKNLLCREKCLNDSNILMLKFWDRLSRRFTSSIIRKTKFGAKNMKKTWLVCRELFSLSLVGRGSKSLLITDLWGRNVTSLSVLEIFTYVYKLFGLIWTLWSLCRILLCNSDNVDLLLSACKNETTKGVIFVLRRSAHMSLGYLHDKHTPPDILPESLYSSMLNLHFLEWLLQLHTIWKKNIII